MAMSLVPMRPWQTLSSPDLGGARTMISILAERRVGRKQMNRKQVQGTRAVTRHVCTLKICRYVSCVNTLLRAHRRMAASSLLQRQRCKVHARDMKDCLDVS